MVVTGRFAITLEGRAMVAEVGPGQPIGEIAFLAGGTRTATVTALRDSVVLRLGRPEFEALSAKSPGIWRTLTVTLARRVAEGNVEQGASARPAPAHHSDHSRRCQRTARGLCRPARRYSPANERVLDTGRNGQQRAARPMRRSTAPRRRVRSTRWRAPTTTCLFMADHDLTAWSQKAIRQADLVLAVGLHGADATPNPLERLDSELLPAEARRPRRASPHARACIRDGALARDRTSPCTITSRSTVRRYGAPLPLHQRHGARPRRLRRRRILRGAHRPLQGADEGGADIRHRRRHLGRRGDDRSFRHGQTPRRHGTRHARHFVTNRAMQRYTWPRYSLLDHRHYDTQLALFRRYQHRGSVDPLLRRLHQPVELRAAPARRGDLFAAVRASDRSRCCCRPSIRRKARCWSTAACSTTCRSAPCTS